ncbi:phosphate regulon sensor histidine kinase PhoR [Paraglaciecola aquimarina]|uniref:histidine kinase n=1 Tax=Paraglaciecola aquimarina TaxID=1235557 RepID=A0ABU3SW58_9ALTE|nr:phosphate regulon sensor histidine kinase PhoR [Paraglaciecola aquimarina]MDU0354255.1 phosphate regulon sensor histidine kinase PhoR [Paraglaciecola aquimarina]
MYHRFMWVFGLAQIAIFLLLTSYLGYYFGYFSIGILSGALILLGLQYWRLHRLNYWLWHSKRITPPNSRGVWANIYEGVYAAKLSNRNKRKGLGEIIRRFREGAEALPDAAVVVDETGGITWCNRLARIELGIKWPEDTGQNINDSIKSSLFRDFFKSKRFDKPIEIRSPINSSKVLEIRVVPYGEQDLMLLIRDVTRLIQIEKMRKDFVANVSHELKTPLTVINGYLEMLPEDGSMPPEMMNKAISEMRSQSTRMQSLIEELLVLSRIEASTERTFEKLVNVPQILWQIQAESEALNREKKHRIFFDISPILYVYGIETELRSAFSNLIFNAIHYTPPGGVIQVTWGFEGQQAKFSVKDNGEGIAAEHIERLTERFYRVDKARSRTTGGSGLGLSIVKHVLSHHNTKLVIESVVGRGAEFSCRFSPELISLIESDDKPEL